MISKKTEAVHLSECYASGLRYCTCFDEEPLHLTTCIRCGVDVHIPRGAGTRLKDALGSDAWRKCASCMGRRGQEEPSITVIRMIQQAQGWGDESTLAFVLSHLAEEQQIDNLEAFLLEIAKRENEAKRIAMLTPYSRLEETLTAGDEKMQVMAHRSGSKFICYVLMHNSDGTVNRGASSSHSTVAEAFKEANTIIRKLTEIGWKPKRKPDSFDLDSLPAPQEQ